MSASTSSVISVAAPRWLRWNGHADPDRGRLRVIDTPDMPFVVKRFFVIDSVPKGVVRGGHAHRSCQQVLLAMKGRAEIAADWGGGRGCYELVSGGPALWVPVEVGIEMRFHEENTSLMVLASHPFDPNDYIAVPNAGAARPEL